MSAKEYKQKMFADYYMANGGNAYQAAIDAGYSEKYAKAQSYKLLEIVGISNYIKERMKEVESKRIMDVKEALEMSTSIARGEPQKFISRKFDEDTEEWAEEEKWYSARIEERQRSLEHIFKCNGAFIDKADISGALDLKVVVDYGDEGN